MIDIAKVDIQADEDIGDIFSCLCNLFSIMEGTQPLDRELGLKTDYLSLPTPVAKNKFSLDVFEKVKKYEPRAEVVDIQFASGYDGALIPTIKVRRVESG